MKYSKNKDGWYESEANSDAQAAYEQLKANNRTYQFADEKTKKKIDYISDYYLQKVPESVKAAWQETVEETGVNPFQTDVTSTLTQLSVCLLYTSKFQIYFQRMGYQYQNRQIWYFLLIHIHIN